MAKIYVASSWRNQYFPEVVKKLREYGHEVYDFRNPPHDHGAFMWKNVDPDFEKWTVKDLPPTRLSVVLVVVSS